MNTVTSCTTISELFDKGLLSGRSVNNLVYHRVKNGGDIVNIVDKGLLGMYGKRIKSEVRYIYNILKDKIATSTGCNIYQDMSPKQKEDLQREFEQLRLELGTRASNHLNSSNVTCEDMVRLFEEDVAAYSRMFHCGPKSQVVAEIMELNQKLKLRVLARKEYPVQ